MHKYLNELRYRSKLGDINTQVNLTFKLYYDVRLQREGMNLAFKLRNKHKLFLGMNIFWTNFISLYEPIKPNIYESINILNQIIGEEENEVILSQALNMMGFCYKLGVGVEKNEDVGIKYYQKAAILDNDLAHYNLGLYYWGKSDYYWGLWHYIRSASRYNDNAIKALRDILWKNFEDIPREIMYLMMEVFLKLIEHEMILHHSIFDFIVRSGLEWNLKYHRIWPGVAMTVMGNNFRNKVVLIIWIAKLKRSSCLSYVRFFHRDHALCVIRELAKMYNNELLDGWLNSVVLDS